MTPGEVFVAEDDGPPRRRFWITRDSAGGPEGSVRGWTFVFDEWRDGDWQVGADTWEHWFFEIQRYPSVYASRALAWRREGDEEIVDLDSLQEALDGVRAGPDDIPESVGLSR
jgi:hypothetical protein